MGDEPGYLVILVVLTMLLLVPATLGTAMVLRAKAMRTDPVALPERAPDGAIVVPVRGLYLQRAGLFRGWSSNSVNPRLAIMPGGIRYRLFTEGELPFSSIEHVEVRKRFGSVYLLFVNADDPRLLSVNVGSGGIAKQVLDMLPDSVALTPEAATIRDGSPSASSSGLHLYHGRFA